MSMAKATKCKPSLPAWWITAHSHRPSVGSVRSRQKRVQPPNAGAKAQSLSSLRAGYYLQTHALLLSHGGHSLAVVAAVHVGHLHAFAGGLLHVGKKLLDMGTLVLIGRRDVGAAMLYIIPNAISYGMIHSIQQLCLQSRIVDCQSHDRFRSSLINSGEAKF